MANGYGGSSGSSSSSSSSSSSNPLSTPDSLSTPRLFTAGDPSAGFVKVLNGVKAPQGFHYMPNGKLMNDADHIAANGYIEKNIRNVSLNYNDISPTGSSKVITIEGDVGIVFSIEIYEGNKASYYNFKTKTWSATSYKQTNTQGLSGSYSALVFFPAQSSKKTFTINVYAETVENIRTKHVALLEIRHLDGSLNINASTGSDSNVITKVLYQDVIKNLYLSVASPTKTYQSTGVTNGAVSSNRMVIVGDATDPNIVEVGDLISVSNADGSGIAGTLGVLVTKINPDGDNIHEIEMSAADAVDTGRTVTFFPAFRGMTPNHVSSTTGRAALEVVSGSSGSYPFSITIAAIASRGFSSTALPTTEDLCAISEITFGADPLPVTGEDTSSDTFYRWPVTNIANLANGMALDPSRSNTGANTTTPAIIGDYGTSKTLQRIDETNRYYTDFQNYTEQDIYVSGVDPAGNAITAIDRNGRITAQAGRIAFSKQQADALKADADVLIIAQGAEAIQQATGMQVSVSNTTITPTQVSTTTTAASSASTTIALTEVGNVLVGQTVRGVGINSAVANPTVVSKAAATGASEIVVSSAQTLEDGVTLFFDGPSNELLLKGRINVINAPIADTTLYFNVEGFLAAG